MVFASNKNKCDFLWSVLHKSDIVHTSWHMLAVMPYLTHELQRGWRSMWLSPGPDLKAPSCFPLSAHCLLMEPHAWDSALICRHRSAAEPRGSRTFTYVFRGKRNCVRARSDLQHCPLRKGKSQQHSLAHDGAPLSRLVRETARAGDRPGPWNVRRNTKERWK